MAEKQVIFRKATVADAPELLEIYSYYVKNTVITFEWDVPSLEDFQSRIKNTLKRYPYILAIIDDKIVGYAYAGPFKSRASYDWCVETSIYLHKDERGHGVGKKLLLQLEEILKKMNILNVNACIAYAEPEDQYLKNASFRFHQKMGYRVVGQFKKCGYKFNRWYDMVWMEKWIGDHVENQPAVISFSDVGMGE